MGVDRHQIARRKRGPDWGGREFAVRRAWPPAFPSSTANQGVHRVLVVEDDDAFRQVVTKVLEDAGYEVCEASSGADLLEMVATESTRDGVDLRPFSAIITDVRMPGISGYDALELLRRGPWRHTPVVVMTAFGDAAAHARGQRLGAVAVLDKPFDARSLVDAVSAIAPVERKMD